MFSKTAKQCAKAESESTKRTLRAPFWKRQKELSPCNRTRLPFNNAFETYKTELGLGDMSFARLENNSQRPARAPDQNTDKGNIWGLAELFCLCWWRGESGTNARKGRQSPVAVGIAVVVVHRPIARIVRRSSSSFVV